MEIDLRRYVVAKQGTWFQNEEYYRTDKLELRDEADSITLAGPVRVWVAVSALNSLQVYGTSAAITTARDAFSYILDLAPGQTWTYASTLNAIENVLKLGSNAGYGIVIRPAGPGGCASDPCAPDPYKPADPCASNDPCAPRGKSGCGCKKAGCGCGGGSPDALPCDFAVASHPDIGFYFPSTCEPCTPGASIGVPPSFGTSLVVPPAPGGTVRTRYFDGMSIAKEDFETDWKNARLKRSMSNRALGQGVVWGFRVARDGSAVCVTPGYGIDCCGNDVILSSPYRVESDALVRDPAARGMVGKRGPQRMHLVLEYFECPERPRPVHGDACGRDTARCEMSRIRETARLRLVPPCDVDDSGPIKSFLDELAKLKNDPQLGPIFDAMSNAPTGTSEVPVATVPFDVTFELLGRLGAPYPTPETAELQPLATAGANTRARADVFPRRQDDVESYGRVRIQIRLRSGFTFTHAPLFRTRRVDPATGASVSDNTPVSALSNGSGTVFSWTEPVGDVLNITGDPATVEPIPPGIAFELRDWRARDASGNEYFAARTEIDLSHLWGQIWVATPWGKDHFVQDPDGSFPETVLHLQVLPTDVRRLAQGQPPRRYPCTSEACDPTGAPRFPAMFPFMHPDPIHGDGRGDVRAIFLAIFYAWLVSEQALVDQSPADTQREQVIRALYVAVWRSFYGTVPDTDRYRLSEALQRLFEAWCCSLLYPGPTCKCEPHGVVVGCAVVEGGEIRSVDPWGGRRWVVLYPLLSHWGSQFGIMPLDAMASKFFDMLCCIGHLPLPITRRTEQPTVGVASLNVLRRATSSFVDGAAGDDEKPGRSAVVPLGGGVLIFDEAGAAVKRMIELKMAPSRTETLNPVDFVGRVTAAMRAPQNPSPTNQPAFVHYRALGADQLHFVALEEQIPTIKAPPVTPPADAPRGYLRDVVRKSVGDVADVPPLLRDATEGLVRGILGRSTFDAGALAEALKKQNADRIGTLLDKDPDALVRALGADVETKSLAEVLAKADRTARNVGKITAETVAAGWNDRTLFTREDFADAKKAKKLSKALVDRLSKEQLGVGAEDIVAVLKLAAEGKA